MAASASASASASAGDADDGAALLENILEVLEMDKDILPAARKDFLFSAHCIGGEDDDDEEEEEEVLSTPPLAQPDPQAHSLSQLVPAGEGEAEAEGEDGIGIGIAMSSMNLLTLTLPPSPSSPAASSSSSDSPPPPRKPPKPRKPMIKRRAGTKIWPPATPPSTPTPAASPSPSPTPELDRLVWALSMVVPTRPRPENENALELFIQKLFPRIVESDGAQDEDLIP